MIQYRIVNEWCNINSSYIFHSTTLRIHSIPVNTWRSFNVDTTLRDITQRRIDVETTLYVYLDAMHIFAFPIPFTENLSP